MKQTLVKHELIDGYNYIMEQLHLEIEELTKGEIVYFGENGFEDDSSNDLCAVSPEGVYDSEESGAEPIYQIYELSFWDGIKVLEILLCANK